jgi:hypothetical protein
MTLSVLIWHRPHDRRFFKLSPVKNNKFCRYAIQKPIIMPMKQNLISYVLTNGKQTFIANTIGNIAVCANDLQPSTAKVMQFRNFVPTAEHWLKLT